MGHPSMKVFSAQSLWHFFPWSHTFTLTLSLSQTRANCAHTQCILRGRQSLCLVCYGSYACICPGIEGIDLWRSYLEARMCWWYSSCIGALWAEKKEMNGEKKGSWALIYGSHWVVAVSGVNVGIWGWLYKHAYVCTQISLLMLHLTSLSV